MKSTGTVRKLDELGRIVLPIALRRDLGIKYKDGLEFSVDNDRIILHKYQPSCAFCGSTNEITRFKGKNVCQDCLSTMAHQAV